MIDDRIIGMGKFRERTVMDIINLGSPEDDSIKTVAAPSKAILLDPIIGKEDILVPYFCQEKYLKDDLGNWSFVCFPGKKSFNLHFDFRYLGYVFSRENYQFFSIFYKSP